VLRDQLLAQRNAIDEALQALAEYRGGRGRGAGLRDYWRDERNCETQEGTKARPSKR